jgi:hypothetical protein
MAKISDYRQQTRVSGADLGAGPTNEGRGLGVLARAVADTGAEIHQIRVQQREEDAAVWATQALSEAQTEWTRRLEAKQQEATEGAPDFTPNVLKEFDAYQGELANKAPTSQSRAYVKQRLAVYRSALADQALSFEAQQRAAHTEKVDLDAIDAGSAIAFQQPQLYDQLVAERWALFDSQRMPPSQRQKLKDQAQQAIAYNAVLGIAEGDAAQAASLLMRPAGKSGVTAVDHLSADDRIKLLDYSQRKRLADANQEFAALERAEQLRLDETQKDGDELLAAGNLSARWVESNRDNLSTEDYRYFLGALSGDGESSDEPRNRVLYADLRERASYGEDIRTDARTALASGDIRVQDFNNLLGEVESSRPGWHRQGAEYISTSAAVSDLNPDPAAAQRKAAMLDDWSEWARLNPKASGEQARGEYKRIVQEYAIVDYEQMLLMKRKPRYLSGTRSAPDFIATAQATQAAFDAGEIDQGEYDRQKAIIVELSESWQRAQTK